MKAWERRARIRIEESAGVRRFVEAKAREVEARSSLQRASTAHLSAETRVKEIERYNSRIDGYLMEVTRQRTQWVEAKTAHVSTILRGTDNE